LFILSPPKRRVVRLRNFAHRRVTTMCRTSAGFMSIGVVVTKIMTFVYKMRACKTNPAGWLAGCSSARHVHYY